MKTEKLSLILGIACLSAIPLILAVGYIFSTFSFTFNVGEPLTIYYSAGNQTLNCDLNTITYTEVSGSSVNLGTHLPGDSKRICFKIDSTADETIEIFNEFTYTGGVIQNITNTIPTEIFPGVPLVNRGHLDYVVNQSANGTFTGSIEFSR